MKITVLCSGSDLFRQPHPNYGKAHQHKIIRASWRRLLPCGPLGCGTALRDGLEFGLPIFQSRLEMAIRPAISLVSREYYLPRLARVFYQADAVVHWEMSIAHRSKGWLTPTLHFTFREWMVHSGARYGLICPVYCLMPDHIHLVWMGVRLDSDQLNAMAFLRTGLRPLLDPAELQHQPYDHVLRDQERRRAAFETTCGYILANPIKAGLATRPEEYPFTGAIVPGYPRWHPCDAKFWPRLWALYAKSKDPAASMVKRPIDRTRGPSEAVVAADAVVAEPVAVETVAADARRL